MKKLVPYFIAAALALPFVGLDASSAHAQPRQQQGQSERGPRAEGERGPRGHHGRHRDPAQFVEHRARMLTAMLDLDAHQSAEVRRILTRSAGEMQALRAQGRNDSTRSAMQAIHQRAKADIDALLNPTQRQTLDRVEAARREMRAQRGQHRQGGPRGARGERPAQGGAR